MKKLIHAAHLTFVLSLSFVSISLREKDPTDIELLSREIAKQLTAMSSMAPSGNAFTEVALLASVHHGNMAWGDYDGDGDYDVVVTGSAGTNLSLSLFSKLYKNTSGVFAEDTSNPLIQLFASTCDWGDYDNDGDIDLLITGYSDPSSSATAAVIYNNANGVLTAISTPSVIGAGYSSCSWIDFDNDGDLDVSIVGLTPAGGNSVGDQGKLYRNDGGGVFTLAFSLLGVDEGDAVWADYDNDKDMDVFMTGTLDAALLQSNNGAAGFTFSNLYGLTFSAAVWGDFDADGDPDLVVTGEKYNSEVGTINLYKNNGTGALTSFGAAGLVAHYGASITTGDYDNDGDLDILLTGATSPSTFNNTDLYANDGTGNFTVVSNTGLDGMFYGEAKWADYDNDGDLDLILSGANDPSYDGLTKIYRNDLNPANAKPTTPAGLTLTQSGSTLNFNWDPSTDAQGGKVTYNLRVGTTPGGSELMSSGSNLSTGYHLFAEPGNVQGTTSWKIQNSSADKIYWSVQAIDNSLLAGSFTTESSYTHLLPVTNLNAEAGHHKIKLTWVNPNSNGSVTIYRETAATESPSNSIATSVGDAFYNDDAVADGPRYYYYVRISDNNNVSTFTSADATTLGMFTEMQTLAGIGGVEGRNLWGDYDHDGDYDISVTGSASGGINPIAKLYKNDNGTFTETSSGFTAVPYGWASWNDFDNDNDLDVLITSSSDYTSRALYKNTDGVFTDATAASQLQPTGGYHGWADWDNDGDMDLVVSQNNASFTARNDGAAGFSTAFDLEGGTNIKWADYDNDGDQDFVMFGQANSYIIFNNDKGIFTKVQTSNLFVSFAFDCAWVDVDNDGKLDLVGSGNYPDGYLKVYRNTASGFTLLSSVGDAGLMFTSLAAGDYDNDGDSDIALTGISYVSFNSFTKLLSNDGTGHYTEVVNTQLPNVSEAALTWCDYDHDGDLDLLLSGGGDDGSIITKVFRNNLDVGNAPPSVPAGPQASVEDGKAIFEWNASTDAQGGAITYNLRVGTTPNGSEILSPMADINSGKLLTPSMGNVQLNRTWTLALPPGTYYWSVQSVDGAYAASGFTTERQLVADYPSTTGIADQVITYGNTKSLDLSSSFTSASAITYSVAVDNNTTVDAEVNGATLNISTLNAGIVKATVTAGLASGGENSASFLITVEKAALQIMADDTTIVYHGMFPDYAYKVTGLKLADTESVISPAPTVTGPDVTSDAGTYPLVVHTGSAANYTITTTNGILTIDKAAGQVSLGALAQTFDNLPKPVTVTVVPSGLEVDVTYNGSSTVPSSVGNYDVVATINDINYQGSATGALVISTITGLEDASKQLAMYPNPVKDDLYVNAGGLENARVSIMNMLGQEVRNQNLESSLTMIDCRTLSTGMFLVIVYDSSNRKVAIARIVKM